MRPLPTRRIVPTLAFFQQASKTTMSRLRHSTCFCPLAHEGSRIPMLRVLIDGFSVAYYRWALNALHPLHPDANYVREMHALHKAHLDQVLQRSRRRGRR